MALVVAVASITGVSFFADRVSGASRATRPAPRRRPGADVRSPVAADIADEIAARGSRAHPGSDS
jgi:hypothetical protein